MRCLTLVFSAAAFSAPAAALAQAPVRTILLLTGTDTIAVEQVTRGPGRLEGDLLFRGGNQRWHYVASLGAGEEVTALDNEFRTATDTAGSRAWQRARLVFAGDSVFVTIEGAAAPQRLGTSRGALPFINPSFALVEQAIRRRIRLGGDTLAMALFAVAGGQTFPARMDRIGGDTMVVSLAGVPARLAIRADGTITGGTVPAQGLRIVVLEGGAGVMMGMPKPDYSAPPGAPYTAEPVRVPTPMGHRLAGTLTLPSGARGPVPAIVTISGSGPQDRDETIPMVRGYRPFREFADALGRRGVAVLRLDDRGVGESEGSRATATSRDFADDVRAALAWLRSRPEIDGTRLGLVGHSEGGLIAPLVASTDSTLKGIVLLAGPAYTGRKILEFQNRYAIENAPSIPASARDSMFRIALQSLDSLGKEPWMDFFLNHDPLPTARRVRVPVLILQGANDQQVTADQAPVLERAFRAGGNRDVTMRVFPETNHLFLADPNGNPAGYSALRVNTLRPEVLEMVVEWVVGRLTR
jgi:alpha-beta hydrolase superfamily lysophospholipase